MQGIWFVYWEMLKLFVDVYKDCFFGDRPSAFETIQQMDLCSCETCLGMVQLGVSRSFGRILMSIVRSSVVQ